MNKDIFTTKTLVLASLCVALSTVLSFFKLFEMPQGGSVTAASMLPVLFFSLIGGPVPGIIAGIALGLLEAALGGYIYNLPQFFLDYPLAFAFLGLGGAIPHSIKNTTLRFILGAFLAILGKGFMHVLSGVIFFREFAGELNPWIYSLGYNYSFLAVEFVITIIIGSILINTPVYASLKKAVAAA